MNTTATATDARNIAAATAGHWTDARVLDSDLPGVKYLQLSITFGGTIRAEVEVYAPTREFGSASVIVGGVGHLITPTPEMVEAFTAKGGRSIFA